ncbi:autotransporter outer membrane beta-barrel domain-containing protein [Brevundimonas sp. NPDC092305]|uniref:autotransporter outer membrane beta-barrel domain-containing protein n=1 Tax=Brevundimonas sp. NPDC092305 TaxID=3363957 RepID=UPI0038197D15
MRILLATAVAIAPLMVASGAAAEVVISTARTTPITTANATGTGPDTIRLASGGAINVTSGVALTVNSSHSVDLDSGSAISMANAANGSTGILVNGGNTANVIVGGGITITDDITSSTDLDVDNDGDADGQFANGSDRYGVRIVGPGVMTGNLLTEATGSINVRGNNSAGISLETGLVGNIQSLGAVTVVGDNTYGIRLNGDVTGNVDLTGGISARGANAVGVAVDGDIGGGLKIHSSITSTGYRYTTRPADRPDGFVENKDNEEALLFVDELDADDLLQGGPALRVSGNVARGLLLDAGPTYVNGLEGDDDGDSVKNGDEDDDGDGTINRNDSDRDGDGIPDASEGIASIQSFGGAPAIQIGSTTESISLGAVGTGNSAYGFINRGQVAGTGIYDGVAAQGVTIGGMAGQTVTIAGGVRNEGTISATSRAADATALRFGAGGSTPILSNSGTISVATVLGVAANWPTALQIDAGANLPQLDNSGFITANATGGLASITAIRDSSGTLATLNNTGSIVALLGADADGKISGTATAIDVSANTTGFSLVQTGVASTPTSGNPDSDGDGVPDASEPRIFGDVNLGSGADTLDIRNGVIIGNMSFGAGADRLLISGGASVAGAITDSDGLLDINVSNGSLLAQQTTATTISSLNVGADGNLLVNIDPTAGTVGGFNVTGNATFANGAGLGVRFNSLLQTAGRFTLVDAGTLNFGTIDLDQIQNNSPYLYVVTAGADQANALVYADVRRRTAAEADLIPVEASMFDAFYGAIGATDATDIRNVFLSQTNRDDFINLYEQLLPDHSGGPLLSLASGVDAVTRALTGRNASAAPGETSAWVQEINFYADKDKTDTYGFRSEGFGVAGGVERGTGLGAVGLSVAFTSSDLEDPEAEAEEVLSANLLELGLYWRAQGQHWTTWARAAAGYATFESERRFVGGGLNLSNESSWNGFTLAAAAGASYERTFGRFSIRPEIYTEYFGLSEDGHIEEGGGDGFDLEIDDREGHLFSATAAINFGMAMGQDSWLKPELRVGWRQNISVDPGETIARFRSGGGDFVLAGDTIEGGGPLVGFRLNVGNELGMLSVSADAEMIDDYVRYMLFLRASFRF